MKTFPMQFAWRLSLMLLPMLGAAALVMAGAELLGVVDRGAWLGEAGEAERWVAVVVGMLLLPFGLSALAHARLTIDERSLRYLGFGVLCSTRSIAFDQVRRWGHVIARNQRRREAMLVLELQDGSQPVVKLAMYRNRDEVRRLLTERLGEASPATATISGVQFDDPL